MAAWPLTLKVMSSPALQAATMNGPYMPVMPVTVCPSAEVALQSWPPFCAKASITDPIGAFWPQTFTLPDTIAGGESLSEQVQLSPLAPEPAINRASASEITIKKANLAFICVISLLFCLL